MYVIILDRRDGDDDVTSHYKYGVFDVDNNKRINRKHQQRSDSKHTATTNNTNKRRGYEQMTYDKLSSLTRTATPVLSVILIATAILFAGPITTATATTTPTTQVQQIINLQNSAIERLSESDRDVNGIEFTPRWGAVSTIQPNQVEPLFAACVEDEFAVSLMYIFQTPDIIPYQSFPVALPGNSMLWLAVVKNTDTNNAGAASIGVICADENGGGGEGRNNLDITTKTIIQNTVKNIINVQNNQIVNLNNIVNVYQQITNYAVQIASITGNNNTVNQVLSQ